MWFFGLMFSAFCLIVLCYVFGASLLCLNKFFFNFTSSQKICASILIGSASLILLVGWISYLGGTVNFSGYLISGLFVFFLIIGLANKTFILKPDSELWVLLGAMVGMIFLGLLPVFLFHSFNPYNDTFTYISIADYLRTHSFSEKVMPSYYQPMLTQVSIYQGGFFRIGAVFFLSLAAKLMYVKRAVEVYPAVAAFAGMLNLLAIYFFISKVMKLNLFLLTVACFLTVFLFSPIYYALHGGFLPQLFGMAFILFSVACLEHQFQQRNQAGRLGWIIISMLMAAGLISAYSEIFPIFFLTFFFVMLLNFLTKKLSTTDFIKLAFLNGFFFLLFANIEIYRMAHAILNQLHAVVGWHVNFSFVRFAATAFGIQPGFDNIELFSINGVVYVMLLVCFVVLFLIGAVKAIKTESYIWLIPLSIYLLMFLYFTQVNNPFIAGQKWQTWSLFKLCNWAFPFFVIGVCYGFSITKQWQKILGLLLGPLILIFTLHAHYQQAVEVSTPVIAATHSESPFEAYAISSELIGMINQHYHAQPIQLKVSNLKHRQMLIYYLYPMPVYADFNDDGYIYPYLGKDSFSSKVLKNNLVLSSYEKLNDSFTPLPAGLLIGAQPLIINFIRGWYGEENDGKENAWYWAGGQGDLLITNNTKKNKFLLKCEVQTAKIPMNITVYQDAHRIKTILINTSGFSALSIPVDLAAGENKLKIVGDATVKLGDDPRLLAFRVQNLQLLNR